MQFHLQLCLPFLLEVVIVNQFIGAVEICTDHSCACINEGSSLDNTLDAFIFLVEPDEHLDLLVNCDFVVPLGEDLLEARISLILDSEEFATDAVLLPVANTTDVEAAEELDEVLEAHPEGTVLIVKHRVNGFNHLGGPLGRPVTPVPIPLELPPRVSDVHQLISVSLFYLND
jgi:hypothetical protein